MEKKVVDAVNEQIKNEMFSAYLYLSMAAYFESVNLDGFAHWMKMQAKEETEHALKLFSHLCERGERVVLQAIEQPQVDFDSPASVFEVTLAHEQKVTSLINRLYELAHKNNDYPLCILLQWFISEQVEEEANAGKILEQLKMIKPGSGALLMLDRALASRGG